MFAASYTPPRRNRVAWLSSAAVHLLAALLIVQFRSEISAPSARPTRAILIFTPSPAPTPKFRPRLFKPPQPVPLARVPVVIDPPAALLAPLPAVRPITPMLAPISPPAPPLPPAPLPPPPRTTPTIKSAGFSPIIQNEPAKPAPANTKTAGFGVVEATFNGAHSSQRVSSTGAFGSATAAPASGNAPPHQTSAAGFSDAVAAKAPAPTSAPSLPQPQDSTPFEIAYQPRPAYTDEARRLQIEGEVLVEAVFTASGEIQIVRIARGLGHGLNENAIAAVRSIRFRPARHHGQPVDSTATVRVRFELAY